MKSRVLLLIALAVVFPKPLLANVIGFPQLAFGGGYTTSITIINTGTTPVSSTLYIFPEPFPISPARGISLPVGGSTVISLAASGGMRTGWAVLDAGSGTVAGVAMYESTPSALRFQGWDFSSL